jgi:hypothetical protein
VTSPAEYPLDRYPRGEPTLFGETRVEWEQHLAAMHGQTWVDAQSAFLDTEWTHLLERWGDQRDPDAPLTPDPNPNFQA